MIHPQRFFLRDWRRVGVDWRSSDGHRPELLDPSLQSLSDLIVLLLDGDSFHFLQLQKVTALFFQPLDGTFDIIEAIEALAITAV